MHSYYSLLPEQSNVQRVWFGTAVPTSYTVIGGTCFSVHVLTCLPRGKSEQPSFGIGSLVRSRSSQSSLAAVSCKSYTNGFSKFSPRFVPSKL